MKNDKIAPIRFDEWVSELYKPFEKPPNSFFLSEFMEKTKLTRTTATSRINKLIKEGKVTVDVVSYEGSSRNLYKIISR